MNRRWWIVVNVALVWALVWAAVELRGAWRSARAHEAAVLKRRVAAPPLLPWQPLPSPPAVLPATYKEVAQRDLLDRSRDPNVPVEPPPPPPPPPPVPPLPVYHGYMNLAGPMAILSVNARSEHQAVKPGDTIGEFTLRSVTTKEIEFAWRDQVIHKSVEELEDHTVPVQAADRPSMPVPAVAPPPPPLPASPGPGELTHFGVKLCNPGDPSPEGAVVDGFRKVLKPTPFGNSCFWEPVQ